MKSLAVFASGGGTNMEALARYLHEGPGCGKGVKVACVITDHENAYVRKRAQDLDVPCYYLSAKEIDNPKILMPILERHSIHAIILAGYLRLIPQYLLDAYPQQIINIHPGLLPKYGGKGMYGMNVHKAVKEAGEEYTGITIHIIDAEYDKGEILFQAKVPISPSDTPDQIANKVHRLEHKYYPITILRWLYSNSDVNNHEDDNQLV